MVVDQRPTAAGSRHDELTRRMRLAQLGKVDLGPDAEYGPPDPREFQPPDFDKLDFLPAPDLAVIASQLIRAYPELEFLGMLSIDYLWRREGGERRGQPILGACLKPSGLARYLSGASYVIWLAADWLREYRFTRRQAEAVLYHELLHAGAAGLVEHDCEMFVREVGRYGLWKEDLKLAARAFEQLPLAFGRVGGDGGLDQVEIRSGDGRGVRLTSETRERIDRRLREDPARTVFVGEDTA